MRRDEVEAHAEIFRARLYRALGAEFPMTRLAELTVTVDDRPPPQLRGTAEIDWTDSHASIVWKRPTFELSTSRAIVLGARLGTVVRSVAADFIDRAGNRKGRNTVDDWDD